MKIGIVTIHAAHNFGAVLQAYSTQCFLLGLGHDVDIIDYRPDYLMKPYRWVERSYYSKKQPWGFKIRITLCLPFRYLRYKKFESFIKNNLITKHLDLDSSSDYDAFIFGSDQIWNDSITHGDGVFLAQKKVFLNSRNIAYAASDGGKLCNEIAESKDLFSFIGVRESPMIGRLKAFGMKASLVCDPTLLVNSNAFIKLNLKRPTSKKYVVVYQVEDVKATRPLAFNIAQQLGAEVIELATWIRPYGEWYKKWVIDPYDFLCYIKYAECVVTTSFHGTAFSLIFEKMFYCVDTLNNKRERISSLLAEIGIPERQTAEVDVNVEPIDYSVIKPKLEQLRKSSESFIFEALS